jgi:hypothetical protein
VRLCEKQLRRDSAILHFQLSALALRLILHLAASQIMEILLSNCNRQTRLKSVYLENNSRIFDIRLRYDDENATVFVGSALYWLLLVPHSGTHCQSLRI